MLLLAVPLGAFAATRPRTPADRGVLALSVIGLAIHPFVLGSLISEFFSVHLHVYSTYCPLTGGGNAVARQRDNRALRGRAVWGAARLGRPPRGSVARLRAALSAALHADDPRAAARDPERAVHLHGPREGCDGGARAQASRDAQRVRTAPADACGRRGHGDHGRDLRRDRVRAARARSAVGRGAVGQRRWLRPAADRRDRCRRRRLRRAPERCGRCRRRMARPAYPRAECKRPDSAATRCRPAPARAARTQHRSGRGTHRARRSGRGSEAREGSRPRRPRHPGAHAQSELAGLLPDVREHSRSRGNREPSE